MASAELPAELVEVAARFVCASRDPDPARLARHLTLHTRAGPGPRRVTRAQAAAVLDVLAGLGVVDADRTAVLTDLVPDPILKPRSNTMATATKKTTARKAPAKKPAAAAKKAPAKKAAPARKAPAAKKAPAKRPARSAGPAPQARADDTLDGQLAVRAVVPTRLVAPHPLNPRRDLGDIDGLAQSIREQGLLQAIVVFRPSDPAQLPDGAEFLVIAGHRRLAAAAAAGIDVPIDIRDEPSRRELLEIFVTENGQREALDPIAEANVIAAFKHEFNASQKAIAKRLGRSEAFVSERLALVTRLPETVQARVTTGDLQISDALAIATAKDLSDKDRNRLAALDGDSLRLELDSLVAWNRRRALLQKTKDTWPGRLVVTDDPKYQTPKGVDAPFGVIKYGTGAGQINRMPEMDPPELQIVHHDHPTWGPAQKVTVSVWHTAPHLLDPADFKPIPDTGPPLDDIVEWSDLAAASRADAVPVSRLHDTWVDLPGDHGSELARDAHTICVGHRLVRVPWASRAVAVCVSPDLHEPDAGPTWENLAEQYRAEKRRRQADKPTPTPTNRPATDWRTPLGDELADSIVEHLETTLTALGDLAFIVTGDIATSFPAEGLDGIAGFDIEGIAESIAEDVSRQLGYLASAVNAGRVAAWDEIIFGRWLLAHARTHGIDPPAALIAAFEANPDQGDDADETSELAS